MTVKKREFKAHPTNILGGIVLILSILGGAITEAQAQSAPRKRSMVKARTTSEPDSQWPPMTYDIGFAAGTYNDVNYSEINVGLNLFFTEMFTWRNALFGRFASKQDTITGLDTSLRMNLGAENSSSSMAVQTFLGGGYRFVSKGTNAPLAEAGLVARFGSFEIGGGAKALFYNEPALPSTDVQYFIILSGGGSLN